MCACVHVYVYTCALLIDGLGHAMWFVIVPVSRSPSWLFQQNRHISAEGIVYKLFDSL